MKKFAILMFLVFLGFSSTSAIANVFASLVMENVMYRPSTFNLQYVKLITCRQVN